MKFILLLLKLIERRVTTRNNLAAEEEDTEKVRNHDKLYFAKKATESGTQGKTNTLLERHIDLTGSNKVPPLDKYPTDNCPPSH